MKIFAAAVALSVAAIACAGRPVRAAEPGNGHHRGLQSALARGDVPGRHQAAEARPCERHRHHVRRAAAGCLCGGIQYRRIPGRRQRLGAYSRSRRHPRHQTSYLFNLFDYWGTVVTSRSDIKTLADLAGKQLAAAKGTTNYTMFAWLAKEQGVDPTPCRSSIPRRPAWSATRSPIAPMPCSFGSRPIRWSKPSARQSTPSISISRKCGAGTDGPGIWQAPGSRPALPIVLEPYLKHFSPTDPPHTERPEIDRMCLPFYTGK